MQDILLNMTFSEPIDSIRLDGTLGFHLGDSESLVLSRIKHLKLATEENLNEYLQGKNLMGDFSHSIKFAYNTYNLIDYISFEFYNGALNDIYIKFIEKDNEVKELIDVLAFILNKKLGKCSFVSIKEFGAIYSWLGGVIDLSYSIKDKKPLTIRIGDKWNRTLPW